MSALSAVAEKSSRIEEIISNKEYPTDNGVFRVKFFIKNQWVSINVDDRIPVKDDGKPWGTQRSVAQAWWMPLTEKAFAKVSQNYDRLIGGNGIEALRVVTGKPALRVQHYDKRDLWDIHKFWADNNFPATAGCCN